MRHKKSHLFFTIIFVQSAELNVPANFPLKFYPKKNIYINTILSIFFYNFEIDLHTGKKYRPIYK